MSKRVLTATHVIAGQGAESDGDRTLDSPVDRWCGSGQRRLDPDNPTNRFAELDNARRNISAHVEVALMEGAVAMGE